MLLKSSKIHPLLSIVLPVRRRFILILRLPFEILPIFGSPGLISVILGPGTIRTLSSCSNRSAWAFFQYFDAVPLRFQVSEFKFTAISKIIGKLLCLRSRSPPKYDKQKKSLSIQRIARCVRDIFLLNMEIPVHFVPILQFSALLGWCPCFLIQMRSEIFQFRISRSLRFPVSDSEVSATRANLEMKAMVWAQETRRITVKSWKSIDFEVARIGLRKVVFRIIRLQRCSKRSARRCFADIFAVNKHSASQSIFVFRSNNWFLLRN